MGQHPFETEVEPMLASLMLRCWLVSLVRSLTHAFAPDESVRSPTLTWLPSETDEATPLGRMPAWRAYFRTTIRC
jgi:hypothetical protein